MAIVGCLTSKRGGPSGLMSALTALAIRPRARNDITPVLAVFQKP